MLEFELDNYLDKLKKSQMSGDIDEQFSWLEKITDYLYQHNDIRELTNYLNMRLELALKTNRLDQEMWVMIAFKSLYHYITPNAQEEFRCIERIQDIGMQIKAIKGTYNVRFRNLYGEEALKIVDHFLSQNEAAFEKFESTTPKIRKATRFKRETLPINNNNSLIEIVKLRVFLCHSICDKPAVRRLYHQLITERAIDPWLDEMKILPGQDWDYEIVKAIRETDVVIVCLSRDSINKEGYVQKEIVRALDVANEKPQGTIFIVPLKLEECQVPERLSRWQWVDLFEDGGYEKLMRALQHRASTLDISV